MSVHTPVQRWIRAARPGTAALVAMTLGCMTLGCSNLDDLDPEVANVTQALGGSGDDDDCETDGCGLNSPIMAGLSMAEFSRNATQVTQSGLQMAAVIPPPGGPPLMTGIDVIDGELVGLDSAGHIVASGPNMVGTQLKFVHSSKPGEWFVKFENFQQRVRHWIGPIDPLPTYRITWTEPGADPGGDPAGTAVTPTNLCPNPPVIDSTDPLSTSWSGAEAEVLLFTGERYDFDTGAVLATGTDADGWINIACALTARSKMILYRHKPTTQVGTEYFTTPEQRETLLRMFRADYWGNGVPHTVQGETLVWQDSYSWMTGDDPQFFSGGRGSLEGIWTKNGVLCLDTPRRFAEDPGLATLEQPEEYVGGIWDDIANSGPDGSVPPPCTGVIDYDDGDGVQQLDLDDWDSLSNIAHMRSWNPLGE